MRKGSHNSIVRVNVVLTALSVVFSFVEHAFATPAVPAPIMGAGLPGLVILGGVYGAVWLKRKLRNRCSDVEPRRR